LIIGIFIYIIVTNARLVFSTKSISKVRRATAATLPFIVLVFIIVSEGNNQSFMIEFMQYSTWIIKFLLGCVFSIILFELGRIASHTNSDIGISIYSFLLSLIGAFIIYFLMAELIYGLTVMLLGLVVGGSLEIIFRGPLQFYKYKSDEIYK